jgi:hypothetical protein
MEISSKRQRILGIFGILGGLVLFAGDMLFYYAFDSTDLKLNMGHASDLRIILSGISALLATWFYMLGLGQIYYAFKPASGRSRNVVTISLAAIFIAYGIIHAAYVAIAATSKLAVQFQIDIETATALASYTNNLLRLFVYPFFALLSFVFIYQVWSRKTLYPRWMVFFFPLLPFLLRGLIGKYLHGSLKIVIMGGYFNLMLVVFFTASTFALWNSGIRQKLSSEEK